MKHCEANRSLKRRKSDGDPARRSGETTKSKAAATKKRKEPSNASVEPKHTATAAAKKDKTTTKGNNTSESRRDQLRAIIRPEMDWAIVWPTLKDNGWVAKPGRGLVSWYLCCPEYANKSVGDMLRHGERGQDYFCSSDDLRQYCVDELGWVGYEIKKKGKDDAVDAKAACESRQGDDAVGCTVDKLQQLIAPDMHWMEVMAALKASGWAVKPGRGLVTYYYCNSKFANESVSNMLAHGVRNEDYFCSSQELRSYCHSKYAWNGNSGAVSSVTIQGQEKRAPAPKTKHEAQKKRGRSRPRRQTNDERKRQRKNTIIDLTEDATDPIDHHGRERSNQSLARLSEELAKVTMEKNEIQKKLIIAKDDIEDAQELAQQQALAIDILQGRIDKFASLLAEVGVDAKVIEDIRDRPLSSGH